MKWTDVFCRENGASHALDYMCNSLNTVVVWIAQWLHDGWGHSCSAGYRHLRGTDPGHSGTKTIVVIWTLAREGEYLERGWSAGPERFC